VVVLAAAVVPHPPLLVPDLAAGAAGSIAPLLAACDAVVAGLLAHSPRTVVLIGSGRHTGAHAERDTGTLAGFGAPGPGRVEVAPGPGRGEAAPGPGRGEAGSVIQLERPTLPLSLVIGRWLLERAGWPGPDDSGGPDGSGRADGRVVLHEVAADASLEQCVRLGTQVTAETGPESVWLVLGDGSTRRGPRSPGHDDPRAAGFDAAVARAFATGDLEALLALDPELSAELGVAGRPVWQALAAAVAVPPGWPGIDATVHYDEAPFGVEYLVADWRPKS
jgi:hypothetical protein